MVSKFNFKAFRNFLSANRLIVCVLIAVALGFFAGIWVNEKVQNSTDPSPTELAMFITFPGEIFLQMLQLLVLPLVVSSVIVSLAILDKKSAAKLGTRFACYSVVTTLLAVIIGVTLAHFMIETKDSKLRGEKKSTRSLDAVHSVLDLIRNLIPENIIEASFFSVCSCLCDFITACACCGLIAALVVVTMVATKYKERVKSFKFVNYSSNNIRSARNISKVFKNKVINPWTMSRNIVELVEEDDVEHNFDGLEKYNSTNFIGVLFISVLFGSILSILGEEGKPIVQLASCLFKVMMKMVDLFIWFTPMGILSIIAGNIAGMKDIENSLEGLAMYIITMLVSCLVHGLVILPTTYFILLRRNPFRLLGRMTQVLLTAFGTASSSSTIPITLSCLETKHKVDSRISQFIIPVGTTINKDGSAIYNAVSAMYIAQTQHGLKISIGLAVIICLASTVGSVVAAPIPGSAPIVSKTIVLQAIGVRSADISLILAVDWLISRMSTPLNVWANCVASVIIEYFSRHDLSDLKSKPNDGDLKGINNEGMETPEAGEIAIEDDIV